MAPRDDDGQEFAGIDPALMRAMIKDLENAKSLVESRIPGLKAEFDKVGLSTKPITTLTGVAAWVGGELPMLNRRQGMAEQLLKENGQYGFTSPMVQTEWTGLFASKAEAEAKAKELAGKYQQPGGFPDDVWDQIVKYQNDPDFAEAFLKALGPEKAAWIAGRLRTWGEQGHEERLKAFATLMGVASHRGVIDDAWLEKFTTSGQGPDLYTVAALIQYGVWDTKTLVNIGNRALKGSQLGGGNVLTAQILDGISHNPLAAHQLYSENFDLINNMAYGKLPGWTNTTNPKLGDPLGAFMKAATVDAAEVFERSRPPGDQSWVNPADQLALRLFQTVGAHPGERFAFPGVENAFVDVVQRFFKGTYTEDLLPEGGMTWYDAAQLCADLAGIFDPTPISDGVSGLMALGQGDWKGALLSAAAMIPYFGDAAAKPIQTFLKLIKVYPALKIFFKVPDDALGDLTKLQQYVEAITKGFEDLKNTVKVVLKNNPGKLLDALGVVNRLHTDAEKLYARYPRWAEKAKSLNLPTDGPVPFVPPKNWNPRNPQKDVLNGREGFVDAYGNVWHKGPGRGGQPYEWDVQVKGQGGISTLTGDGSHLNVEWGTGRVTHG
ncbi:polymorphic toxin type 17 domain-containing protein [Microbispora sp. NPDC049125]|uniref:polymorphic toxin type 17 domain-containing protein n=1 Tax=Microbispora sp. NPDC049125 TaxID=3154929 RepID=UPI003466863A